MENDLVQALIKNNKDLKYKTAVGIAFIVFTPVLILVSWILQILVDDPYKDFAYEVDIVSRIEKPNNIKNRSGVENKSNDSDENERWFVNFLKQSWKFFGLMFYFLSLYIITESY